MQLRLSLPLSVLSSLIAGCTLSTAGKTACDSPRDCIAGYTCVAHTCIASSAAGRDGSPVERGATADGGDASNGPGAEAGSSRSDPPSVQEPDAPAEVPAVDGSGADASASSPDPPTDDGGHPDDDPCTGTQTGASGCELTVVELTAGLTHTCARLRDGKVKCWGGNGYGQLGLGDTASRGDEPAEMGDALPAVELGGAALMIDAGRKHTCALLDGGTVKCWGNNAFGQLGQGSACLLSCGQVDEILDNRGDQPDEMGDALPAVQLGSGRKAIAISAGDYFSCALLDDETVKCWGANDHGQLGLGSACLRGCTSTPVYDHRGDEPGEMGDALSAVPLGSGRSVEALHAGGAHACAVLDDGTVKCWGLNTGAQLGQGDLSGRGDAPGELGDQLASIQLGTDISALALAAGTAHSCALLATSAVKCWGENLVGQLGLGDVATRGAALADMGDTLPIVQLGAQRVSALQCGSEHCCAVLDNAALKCWGRNDVGQLGLGDARDRGLRPGEMGDDLPTVPLAAQRVAGVATGERHTCAIVGGSVRCFGYNEWGQLGLGTTDSFGDDPADLAGAARVTEVGH